MDNKWHYRYLSKAEYVAKWSKDAVKVGAAIYDNKNRPVSEGFNGLPQHLSDTKERYASNDRIVLHAEVNAILFAKQDLTGCTIYVSRPTCGLCAALIIQSGISRVVVRDVPLNGKWQLHAEQARSMYAESKRVELIYL